MPVLVGDGRCLLLNMNYVLYSTGLYIYISLSRIATGFDLEILMA